MIYIYYYLKVWKIISVYQDHIKDIYHETEWYYSFFKAQSNILFGYHTQFIHWLNVHRKGIQKMCFWFFFDQKYAVLWRHWNFRQKIPWGELGISGFYTSRKTHLSMREGWYIDNCQIILITTYRRTLLLHVVTHFEQWFECLLNLLKWHSL